MSHTILREKVRIGSKGQVVIPVAMRKIMGIAAGSEVIFEMDDQKSIRVEQPMVEDPIAVFRSIAKKINFKGKLDMNKLYDEHMEERWSKKLKGR